MIKKLWKLWFPDPSVVKAGTLWLRRTPRYREGYGDNDLLEVFKVSMDWIAHTSCPPFKSDKGLPSVYSWPEVYYARELLRTHRLIDRKEAEAMGYRFSSDRNPADFNPYDDKQ